MSEITSAKAPKLCLCGCSQTTGSMFRMGHDARMVSNLLKDIKAGETTPAKAMKALPSAALQAKLQRAIENAAKPKTPKGKQQCDRCGAWVKEGNLSHDDELGAICDSCIAQMANPTEVKVGRWWYRITGANENGVEYEAKDGSIKTAKVDAETR